MTNVTLQVAFGYDKGGANWGTIIGDAKKKRQYARTITTIQ
jgi:hypothetical protein